MHIEPGVVEGAKVALSFVTAAGAIGFATKLALGTVKQDGIAPLAVRSGGCKVFCVTARVKYIPLSVLRTQS
ncbi:MAG: hypothetical protein KZQ81_09410 [Candidatus Thiodiazotropha sp. (ex Rostrolucina anterorostrata)]|nr:hypothetical protein [Candidatus Thiodiazotropha sp. (ex Rostrolucina anterorostrata)]